MLRRLQILVSAPRCRLAAALAALLAVGACGQKGPLQLPGGPAAAQRATLPQTLAPALFPYSPTPAASAPSAPASASAARTP